MENGGGDVAAGFTLPEDVGGGDVTFAAELHGGAASGWITAEEINDAVIMNQGRGDIAGEPVGGIPAELAGLWVQTPDLFGGRKDEVGAAIGLKDDGGAVGEFQDVAIGLPELLAGLFIEGKERFAFVGGIDDEGVFIEDGAAAGTPAAAAGTGAERGMPELLASHVKGEGSGLAKENIDVDSVADGSAGGVAVLGDEAFIGVLCDGGGDGSAPEVFAIGETEADEMPHELGHVSGTFFVTVASPAGDEDFVPDDDGAGGAWAWEVELPEEVLRAGPGEWDAGFLDDGFRIGA